MIPIFLILATSSCDFVVKFLASMPFAKRVYLYILILYRMLANLYILWNALIISNILNRKLLIFLFLKSHDQFRINFLSLIFFYKYNFILNKWAINLIKESKKKL
jgi:hypothetical protein